MGTTTNHQRNRASRRGAVSFVAFVLLFAFALGQGSSLFAFANDALDASKYSVANDEATGGTATTGDQAATDDSAAPAADDGGAVVSKGVATTGSEGAGNGASSAKTDAGASTSDGAVLAAPPATELDGGDISLDYVAAGPFTYDHSTGLGSRPQFGYDNRQISKSNGVVESLEAGDFECEDLVTFFTEITVDADAAAGGTIELDYTFGAETTGQPGLGFDDIISVAVNTPDDGNKNLDGDEVATLIAEGFDSSGYDQVTGTVEIAGLDPGDVVIVRLIAELACIPGETPTGNILNAIESGRVTSNDDDTISVGQQTVPMKTSGFVAEPAIDIEKTCPATSPFGDDITYTITITNNGNENLENIVVTDTVDGNTPVDISDLFDDTLAAGASDSAEFVYSPDGSEPDPLPNTVEVSADGVFSSTTVTDTDTCDTDIEHEPAIEVTKTCPQAVPAGEEISYTITVENTGNEALVDVEVIDTLLGDITGDFDFDFTNPFPVGQVATATVTYLPGADEDPVQNTVTATGEGADSGATAEHSASCETDVTHEAAIGVTKSCAREAHEGDTVTYSITVSNTGTDDLEDVTVMDSVLGDLSASFGDTLAVGGSETQEFDYVIPEGTPASLVNLVTVTAVGVDSEAEVSASASCSTDILHPGIAIVKTVSEETVPVGTTVTYTYLVTNTGDTTLLNVSVDDDVMGHIGDIAVLDPGESVTLTKDFVVGEDVVVNVATATGTDILGRTVTASDDAIVTPIAGETPPPPTPFTGSDAGRLAILALALLGIGVTAVATTRRRRSEAA